MNLQIFSNHISVPPTPRHTTIQDIRDELAKYRGCWWLGFVDYWVESKPKAQKMIRRRKQTNPQKRIADRSTRLPALEPTQDKTNEPMKPIDLETEISNLAKWLGFTLVREKIAGRANSIQGWYLIKPGQSPQYLGNDIETIYQYLKALHKARH